MLFLLNYREYYDNLCDEPELSLCNSDQEMSEIDFDITPETVDDDSYSSSFHDSDDKDELTKIIWQMKLKVDSSEYTLSTLIQLLRNYSHSLILVCFLQKVCFIFC